MGSNGEKQRFRIGARVDAADGRCGHLTRIIIDPVAQSLTHLVVRPPRHEELSRLVPVDAVEAVDSHMIRLRYTKREFDQLDVAEDVHFLPADTDPFGYGGDSATLPYYGLEAAVQSPGSGRHEPIYTDRVPLGEVEVRRGDQVHAKDGWIGAVQGLVIDPADHQVTHVLLQEGHLWGGKQVAIPIGSAARVGDEIRVDLTKDQVGELQPVGLSSPQ
jgi:sporulation protein YlmC with PRC-barrel domain